MFCFPCTPRTHIRIQAGLWLACVLGGAAPVVALAGASGGDPVAVSGPASGVPDPELVITRRVQPRIAYRGVPLEANPVASRAAVFPRRVFHASIDGVVDLLAGDDELGARSANGLQLQPIAVSIDAAVAPAHALTAGPRSGPAAMPLGEAARVGGAVGGTTAHLGSIISGALIPAIASGGGP